MQTRQRQRMGLGVECESNNENRSHTSQDYKKVESSAATDRHWYSTHRSTGMLLKARLTHIQKKGQRHGRTRTRTATTKGTWQRCGKKTAGP
jgi:hypothetical protein